jgi:hypothetical protein
MSRSQVACTVAGALLVTGVTGCALGFMLTPASRAGVRRRLTRGVAAMGRAWSQWAEGATERTRQEWKRRMSCAS